MTEDPNYQVPVPPITFIEAIKRGFNNYCVFSGRATRAEYWYWVLFVFLLSICCSAISEYLSTVASVATLLPSLGLAWRCLHDIGRAGGWWFICFIPVVGWILYIYWCCQPSEMQPNRFGAVPPEAY